MSDVRQGSVRRTTEAVGVRRYVFAVLVGLLAFVLAAGVTLYRAAWVAPVPDTANIRIDLHEMRRLARHHEGPLPVAVRGWVVARSVVPRGAVIAGGGFSDHTMVRTAYEVRSPDWRIVIDAGTDRTLHEKMGLEGPFYPDRYRAVQRALRRADTIVATHLHPDHIGGVARSEHREALLPHLLLNVKQRRNRRLLAWADFPRDGLEEIRLVHYGTYYPLAPGVVLVEASGHTPGSQMVYVRRVDGEEYLFVGDVAWSMDNIRMTRDKPRLVSRFFVGENTGRVREQLRVLHDLHAAHPELNFVVSHDAPQHRRLFEQELLKGNFNPR